MDLLTAFGAVAVTAMLLFYALEVRSAWYVPDLARPVGYFAKVSYGHKEAPQGRRPGAPMRGGAVGSEGYSGRLRERA